MIRNKMIFFFLLSLFSIIDVVSAATLTVGQDRAVMRDRPSNLARGVGAAHYGDQAKALRRDADWYFIQIGTTRGWLHKSVFGSEDDILKDIGRGEAVARDSYRDEAVAAGRGFSPEFEEMYRSENRQLNYEQVDIMERFEASPRLIQQFVEQGRLKSRKLQEFAQ